MKNLLRRPPPRLSRLPSGSFTLSNAGRVITYTLPQSVPLAQMEDVGRQVLHYFRGARQAQIPVRELVVSYPALKLTARELRGGAIVFLQPQSLTRR